MKKTATEIATVLSVSIPEKLLEKLTFEYFLPRSRFFSWNFLPASFKPGGMIDFYCDEARGLEDLLATEEGERLVKTLNYHLFSIHAECMSPFLENC
ncbi:hypothetical protein KA013_01620 [Patescibacteria group bacterium]|nr:hypothetical protein [Patescibacteria group bacterium]